MVVEAQACERRAGVTFGQDLGKNVEKRRRKEETSCSANGRMRYMPGIFWTRWYGVRLGRKNTHREKGRWKMFDSNNRKVFDGKNRKMTYQ